GRRSCRPGPWEPPEPAKSLRPEVARRRATSEASWESPRERRLKSVVRIIGLPGQRRNGPGGNADGIFPFRRATEFCPQPPIGVEFLERNGGAGNLRQTPADLGRRER